LTADIRRSRTIGGVRDEAHRCGPTVKERDLAECGNEEIHQASGGGENGDASDFAGADEPQAAALALLNRSISCDHAELAVIRLGIAVDVGARIPGRAWTYCREAAARSPDPGLRSLYQAASGAMQRVTDERGRAERTRCVRALQETEDCKP